MNQELREELLSMCAEDLNTLQELIDNGELGTTDYHPRMKAIHEKNNIRFKEIVNQIGWPGISLVDTDGANAAWLIVQHAVLDKTFMDQCLQLLNEATLIGEAESWCLAYLQDRVLTMSGEPQIYGTQHDIDDKGKAYPLTIAEPENVDELRMQVGLEPLAEATRRIQEQHNNTIINRNKDD